MLFTDFNSFVNFATVASSKDILNWKFVIAYSDLTFANQGFGDRKSFLGGAMSESCRLESIKLAVIFFGQVSHILFLFNSNWNKFTPFGSLFR